MSELDAKRIGEPIVLRQLALVEHFDAVARQRQRVEGGRIAGFDRGVDFGRRDAQATRVEGQPVELGSGLDQRCVTAGNHVANDAAHRGLDVGGNLPLHREEGLEALGKVGAAAVDTDRHVGVRRRFGCPGRAARTPAASPCSMACRSSAVNPLRGGRGGSVPSPLVGEG